MSDRYEAALRELHQLLREAIAEREDVNSRIRSLRKAIQNLDTTQFRSGPGKPGRPMGSGGIQKRILERARLGPFTIAEAAEAADTTYMSAAHTCGVLCKRGHLMRLARGYYNSTF